MNDKEKLRKAFNLRGDQVKMSDKEKIEKIVDRINFWRYKEVTAEDFSIFLKEIKKILEK